MLSSAWPGVGLHQTHAWLASPKQVEAGDDPWAGSPPAAELEALLDVDPTSMGSQLLLFLLLPPGLQFGVSSPFLTSLRSSHVPSRVAMGAVLTRGLPISACLLQGIVFAVVSAVAAVGLLLTLGNEVIEVVDLVGEVPLPKIIFGCVSCMPLFLGTSTTWWDTSLLHEELSLTSLVLLEVGTGIDDRDGGCCGSLVEEFRRATRGEAGGWTGGRRTTETTLCVCSQILRKRRRFPEKKIDQVIYDQQEEIYFHVKEHVSHLGYDRYQICIRFLIESKYIYYTYNQV